MGIYSVCMCFVLLLLYVYIDFCVIYMVHDMYIWMHCVYKDFMRVGVWIGAVCVYAGMSMYGVTLIWV